MHVKANDFTRMWEECGQDVLAAVSEVGASGWYILGPEVKAFEQRLADFCGLKYAVGCGNGMDALEISLRACGLQAGQKVLTTPLSAFATSLAIIRAGGRPVFCDIDEAGLLDLDLVERCLKANPDIRFIMPVHLYGHTIDLAKLKEMCARYGVSIIEDMAQAIGSHRNGAKAGSAGVAACISFYPTKNLGALGDGGAILTNDENLFAECANLRNYGQEQRYVHTRLGLNSRLDVLHAAVLGRVFLPQLSKWTDRRREIASFYMSKIENQAVRFPSSADPKGSVWHLFPVLTAADDRAKLLQWLRQCGVEADIHYPGLIPDQPVFKAQADLFEVFGELTRARKFVDSEISIPINPYLTNEEVNHVVESINAWAP